MGIYTCIFDVSMLFLYLSTRALDMVQSYVLGGMYSYVFNAPDYEIHQLFLIGTHFDFIYPGYQKLHNEKSDYATEVKHMT